MRCGHSVLPCAILQTFFLLVQRLNQKHLVLIFQNRSIKQGFGPFAQGHFSRTAAFLFELSALHIRKSPTALTQGRVLRFLKKKKKVFFQAVAKPQGTQNPLGKTSVATQHGIPSCFQCKAHLGGASEPKSPFEDYKVKQSYDI